VHPRGTSTPEGTRSHRRAGGGTGAAGSEEEFCGYGVLYALTLCGVRATAAETYARASLVSELRSLPARCARVVSLLPAAAVVARCAAGTQPAAPQSRVSAPQGGTTSANWRERQHQQRQQEAPVPAAAHGCTMSHEASLNQISLEGPGCLQPCIIG
jgi:hypothetical protein